MRWRGEGLGELDWHENSEGQGRRVQIKLETGDQEGENSERWGAREGVEGRMPCAPWEGEGRWENELGKRQDGEGDGERSREDTRPWETEKECTQEDEELRPG